MQRHMGGRRPTPTCRDTSNEEVSHTTPPKKPLSLGCIASLSATIHRHPEIYLLLYSPRYFRFMLRRARQA